MRFEAHNRGLRLKTEWIAIPCDRWIGAARRKTQSKLNSPINDNQKIHVLHGREIAAMWTRILSTCPKREEECENS